MANARNPKKRGHDTGRDAGGFVALPWSVLDCPAYGRLSMHARALLLEVARQFVRDNNGRLLLSRAYMGQRGWKSMDMLNKAKNELLEGGFIYQTVMGHRPNKSSWYAVTWRALDKIPGFDAGAVESFRRGAYHQGTPVIGTSLRPPHGTEKNATLRPPHGTGEAAIAPPHGTETPPTVPPYGTIRGGFGPPPVPPHGHHLEIPSTAPAVQGCPDCCIDGDLQGNEKLAHLDADSNRGIHHEHPCQQLSGEPLALVQTAPEQEPPEPLPIAPEQALSVNHCVVAPLGITTRTNATKGRKRPATTWIQYSLMDG